MSHIFISYSHQDSEYAHLLASSLEQAGFTVWIDDRIDYGDEWPDVIREKLDSCAACIIIMTPRAYQSRWVRKELTRAERKHKQLFPLLLEGDEPWFEVETTQYTDVTSGKLPPQRFYDILAKFAPRKGTLATPTFALPLLEWVPIPAGDVTIEGQVYPVAVFSISKYPVTNAQYQAFIDAPDGYCDTQWWDYSEYARRWHKKKPKPREGRFKGDKRPRESVTWYEAIAFCRWLSDKIGLGITLPTETQWQRAAQGDTNWAYPWGDTFDKSKCNTFESGIGETTDVDRYGKDGRGFSPYGVYDLSGNVSEWCLNTYDNINRIGINRSSTTLTTSRGGSGGLNLECAMVTFRLAVNPDFKHNGLGFRLVSSAPNG
ncbi:MAG: SUMF1/EgtB/PvdO family nonheme iron enzyme [Rhodospirillales bacterium]|nr:SUMF1/EgtB/PvdO family nonheme iron enzyme [Rhodospirillales bacterium]